jgi:hypothetical protein
VTRQKAIDLAGQVPDAVAAALTGIHDPMRLTGYRTPRQCPARGHGACGGGGLRPAGPAGLAGKAHNGSYEGTPRRGPALPARQPVQGPAPTRPAETFAVHDQVTHDAYGLGVILGVDDDAVVVDFRPQQRRIPLPDAKLTKL